MKASALHANLFFPSQHCLLASYVALMDWPGHQGGPSVHSVRQATQNPSTGARRSGQSGRIHISSAHIFIPIRQTTTTTSATTGWRFCAGRQGEKKFNAHALLAQGSESYSGRVCVPGAAGTVLHNPRDMNCNSGGRGRYPSIPVTSLSPDSNLVFGSFFPSVCVLLWCVCQRVYGCASKSCQDNGKQNIQQGGIAANKTKRKEKKYA